MPEIWAAHNVRERVSQDSYDWGSRSMIDIAQDGERRPLVVLVGKLGSRKVRRRAGEQAWRLAKRGKSWGSKV